LARDKRMVNVKRIPIILSCIIILSLLCLLIGCKRETSDIRRGIREYHRGSYDRAIRDFNLALKANPQSAEAYFGRGMALSEKKNYDSAIADITRAIEINSLPQFYYERSLVWEEIHDYDKAIKDYTSAINIAPDFAPAYINRAQLYKNKGEFDSAIKDYNKVIELSPNDLKAYRARAGAWYEKGNYDKAINDYTQILNIDDGNAQAIYDRGVMFHELGEFRRAIDDYARAVELKLDYMEAYNNYAWILATCVGADYRDGKKAVALASKAVELRKNTDILDTLAAAYAEAGNFKEAIRIQEKFINTQKSKLESEDLNEAEKQLEYYKAHRPWRDTKIWTGKEKKAPGTRSLTFPPKTVPFLTRKSC
jgi:tetratricopeptide (TPR) repeat protein